MEHEQFYILPEHILEVAELIMDLRLRHSIGRDEEYVMVDISYDPDDEAEVEAVQRFQELDDAGYPGSD